jgi:hypothetical protein
LHRLGWRGGGGVVGFFHPFTKCNTQILTVDKIIESNKGNCKLNISDWSILSLT